MTDSYLKTSDVKCFIAIWGGKNVWSLPDCWNSMTRGNILYSSPTACQLSFFLLEMDRTERKMTAGILWKYFQVCTSSSDRCKHRQNPSWETKSFAKKAEKYPMKETELSRVGFPTERNRRSLGLCSRVSFIVVATLNIDIKECYSHCKKHISYLKQCKKKIFSSFRDLKPKDCLVSFKVSYLELPLIAMGCEHTNWQLGDELPCMNCSVTAACMFTSTQP